VHLTNRDTKAEAAGLTDTANQSGSPSAPIDVIEVSRNTEVSQQDSLFSLVINVGQHDVGRFDVAVQQPLSVGIVECAATAVTMRTTSSTGIPASRLNRVRHS
jgi:hypothetical protein